MTVKTVSIKDRQVRLTNLEKVLYPESGFTKGQVIDYYVQISEYILPHLRDRPLTLKRFPNGINGGHFYEKRCPSHKPEWVKTARVPSSTKEPPYHCVIDEVATLVWTANLASLELHTLLSTGSDVESPTMVVFDLDPGEGAGLLECADIALRMREALKSIGLDSFAKVSGGKGLHFYVPLNTPATFGQTKSFARSIAQLFERQFPDQVVSNMKKTLRAGKVFIDWSQNDQHKTTVTPYSLRAIEGPTVSLPVRWEELENAIDKGKAEYLVFTADDAVERVRKTGDLFEPVLKLKQKLPRPK